MQKELNSDVARFATHIKLVLQRISFFASCEKLLQKVESKNLFILRVLPAQGKLVWQKVKKLPSIA